MKPRVKRLRLCLTLLGPLALLAGSTLLLAAPARAQDPGLAEVEAHLAQVKQDMEALVARVAESGTTPASTRQREELEALERTYLRQRELLRGEETLRERETAAQERLASGPTAQLSQPPPYVLAMLDALADARDSQRKSGETLEAAVEAAKQAKTSAEQAYDEAEKARRLAQEKADQAKGETDLARLGQAAQAAALESRLARARRELAQLELASLERKLAVQRNDVKLLEETVQWVRDNLVSDAQPSDASQERLGDREFAARQARKEADREIESAERHLGEAERRLEEDPQSAARRAEVAARRAELELWEARADATTTELEQVQVQRDLEALRLGTLAGEASRAELLAWQERLEEDGAETERTRRLLDVQRGEVGAELERARAELQAADPAARPWLQREIEALEDERALYEQELSDWQRLDTLAKRAGSEIADVTSRPSLTDRLGDAVRSAESVWRFEVFAVEDRPITVGKVVTALALFLLGFVVARLVSRLVGRLLVRRARLATGAASAIQGLLFYLLLILFFLVALRSVSIPLTAFTVLGGALAIGVGFGSQNIVNNFISGLILLAERPIKVGDMIEVEGQRGHVEWIGARSTRVRTFDNIHIVVPNSVFLERSVVNWTLADDDVRTKVDVGVAYGSDVAATKRVLLQAVTEHEKVLASPSPAVFFMAFGDSALEFRTHFWIRSRDMGERLAIESDVRTTIDRLCRENGITIAFPQRDVHLDAAHPVPVRIVEGEPSAGADD